MHRRQLLHLAGWVLAGPTAAFALLRLVGAADRHRLLFALATGTPLLLLPAYPALAAAVATRRRALGATAAAVVALHLVWSAPVIRWWPHDQPDTDARSFTVVAANVYANNPRAQTAAHALLAERADVLVVIEYTPTFRKHLLPLRGLAEYPHRFEDHRASAHGSAVFSRFPITRADRIRVAGLPMLDLDVDTPSGPIRLLAVHTRQPLSDLGVLRAQHAELGRLVDRSELPTVLAGDFNATVQHAPFRGLLAHGLRDAHLERGAGRTTTWPVGRRFPPLAALDHVLVSGEIAVRAAGDFAIPGSDHRGVSARVALARR